jgi:hypothetical protein
MIKKSAPSIHLTLDTWNGHQRFTEMLDSVTELVPEKNYLVLRKGKNWYSLPVLPEDLLALVAAEQGNAAPQCRLAMIGCQVDDAQYMGNLTISMSEEGRQELQDYLQKHLATGNAETQQ